MNSVPVLVFFFNRKIKNTALINSKLLNKTKKKEDLEEKKRKFISYCLIKLQHLSYKYLVPYK